MSAKVPPPSRLAVVLFLFFLALISRGGIAAAQGPPTALAADLDRAVRAGDLARARELVPLSWPISEQLFVTYLDRAFVTPDRSAGAPDARALAGRLADVFFTIVEFDFARSVVTTLDASDPAKRQQLVAVVRDYFTTLERVRSVTATPLATPAGTIGSPA